MNEMRAAIAELERKLSNAIRWGTIAEADYERHVVRARVDDILTDWLPWMTRRAGGDIDWWAPEAGEQVLVIAPSGLIEDAIVLPAAYSNAHAEPGTSPDRHIVRYKNGDSLVHDRADGSLTLRLSGALTIDAGDRVNVTSSGTAQISAPSVIVDSPETTLTGNATVNGSLSVGGGLSAMGGGGKKSSVAGGLAILDGELTHNGRNVGADHRHAGVEPGGGATGVPI